MPNKPTEVEIVLFLLAVIFLTSCGQNPVPKPKGYFRIDLPEKTYRNFSTSCPFTFDVPEQALVLPSRNASDSCWMDVHVPIYKQTLHLTYRVVGDQLFQLIDDAHSFKSKHQVKADGIEMLRVVNDSARVYGNVFNIEGNVASPMQFYLTDSVQHFVYGALYFNMAPNSDSLAPVVARSKEDILHLVESFRWK